MVQWTQWSVELQPNSLSKFLLVQFVDWVIHVSLEKACLTMNIRRVVEAYECRPKTLNKLIQIAGDYLLGNHRYQHLCPDHYASIDLGPGFLME
jgi:hypothetical protein